MQVFSQAPQFLALDFYCGAGGTTRGLLDSKGYVIAGIDKDTVCRETYLHNNRNTTLDCAAPKFLALDMFPASEEYPGGQQEQVYDALRQLIPADPGTGDKRPVDVRNLCPVPVLYQIRPTENDLRPN